MSAQPIDVLPTAEAPQSAEQREEQICQQLLERGRLKDADFARARRLH